MSEHEKKVSRRDLLKGTVSSNPWFQEFTPSNLLMSIFFAFSTTSRVDAYQEGMATTQEIARVIGVETAVFGALLSIQTPPQLSEEEIKRRTIFTRFKDGVIAGTVFSGIINTTTLTTATIDRRIRQDW